MSAKLKKLASVLGVAALLFSVAPTYAGTVLEDLASVLTSLRVTDPLQASPALSNHHHAQYDSATSMCRVSREDALHLTLMTAVDLAICNNAQLKSAGNMIKIQAAAVGVAKAAYLPSVNVTTGRVNSRTEYSDPTYPAMEGAGNTVSAVLSWRLFDFGARRANLGVADSSLVAAIATNDATLQKTLATVVQVYFDALSGRAAWQAKEQDEAITASTLASARRREADGYAGHGDVLQATTAYARASLEHHRARGTYKKTLAVLTYTLGLPADSDIELAEDIDDAPVTSAPDLLLGNQMRHLDKWLRRARQSHPSIAAARAQLASAQNSVTSVRAAGLPTIDFSANYSKNSYPGQALTSIGTHVNSIGISISIPLFDGFAQTYKVAGAQAQADQRETEFYDTEQSVLMQVVKSHADTLSSLENLDASQILLVAAQDALASSQRKYAKGVSGIVDILSAQSALADARQQRIQCLAEWRSARLRLLADAGLLEGEQIVGAAGKSNAIR